MQRLTNKLFGVIAAGLMMLFIAAPGLAQVTVNMANTIEGSSGDTGTIGVYVGSLDGEDVLAYDFTVEYDASVLSITDHVANESTLSNGISVVSSNPTDSTFQVAAATGSALSGSGALVWLQYEFVADGSSSLELTSFTFNDGTPAASTPDVSVRIATEMTEAGAMVSIPVYADDIAGEGVLSFDVTVAFDADVVTLDAVDTEGTLTENVSVAANAGTGSIQVAGATGSEFDANGVLFYITGMAAADADGEVSALTFTNVEFNDGDPSGAGIEGSLEVGTPNDAEGPSELPGSFALRGNYPNPFNPSTTIRFDLPATAQVSVQIFDVLGRQVMAMPSTMVQAGADRSMQLNASALSSGTYLYRVVARTATDTMIQSGQMTLVK